MSGSNITKLCLESIQFDVDISLIGSQCQGLSQLSVINARISAGRQHDNTKMFSQLTQLYLYLVQYVASIKLDTNTVVTGLHVLLTNARTVQSVQAPGSALLTDTCLLTMMQGGALSQLTKFVISQPISIDHRTVPLSQHTVAALHKHCPHLSLLGDLKHWDIPPPLRRKLIKKYNTCNIALPVALGQFF